MDLNHGFIIWTLIVTCEGVKTVHPECSIVLHLQKKEAECRLKIGLTQSLLNFNATDTDKAICIHLAPPPPSDNHGTLMCTTATYNLITSFTLHHNGCLAEWDGVNCWPAVSVGERFSVSCPPPLMNSHELITRTCTTEGWSRLSVPYYSACFQDNSTEQEDTGHRKHTVTAAREQLMLKSQGSRAQLKQMLTSITREYFAMVKLIYTVGYGVSIGSLCIAVFIFCIFRKLLCTRTYIHLNLFSTFILRALAVFVKDAVLFADKTINHCTVSTVLCKAVVTFFQYCVLSNFYWLLIEGLYLQTLLVFTFAHRRTFFWWYTLIGWGTPSVAVTIWMFLKHKYDNHGCWDDLDSGYWWIIKIPILLSVFVNFLVFVNISRMIVVKTKTPDSNGGDRRLYRRLAKSTLLLIPLFGVHYIVFALFPEHVGLEARLFFELVLGSFQGFIVALLYCFLNSEVQNEIRKEIEKYKSRTDNNTFQMATQDFTA